MVKKNTFLEQLKLLEKFCDFKEGVCKGNILDIGTNEGLFLDVAKEFYWSAYGVEASSVSAKKARNKLGDSIFCGTLEEAKYPDNFFDAIVLIDVLEHIADPVKLMSEVHRIAKPSAGILIITPNFNSWTRKIMRGSWFQYKYEHLAYYSRLSIDFLLSSADFKLDSYRVNFKRFNIMYYEAYLEKMFLCGGLGNMLLKPVFKRLPQKIKKKCFNNYFLGEMAVVAHVIKNYE